MLGKLDWVMLFLKIVIMFFKVDVFVIVKLWGEMLLGLDVLLILIVLILVLSLLMLIFKICVVGVILYMNWWGLLVLGNFLVSFLLIFMK